MEIKLFQRRAFYSSVNISISITSFLGLITKNLNVCGDVNYQITCPENTVLIITGVTKLNGTVCKDSSDCPSDEGLKGVLLRDCFARSACDMNRTTVCSYHNGGLSVKAACAKGVC